MLPSPCVNARKWRRSVTQNRQNDDPLHQTCLFSSLKFFFRTAYTTDNWSLNTTARRERHWLPDSMQAFNNEIGELFSMKICYSHRRNNPTCILLWHSASGTYYQTQGLWHGGPWPIKCLEDGELIGDSSSQLNGVQGPPSCGQVVKENRYSTRRPTARLGQDWR